MSVPLRGSVGESGLFSLANSCGNTAAVLRCTEVADKAYLLSAYLHEALHNLVFQPEGYAPPQRPSLTVRERECLAHWAGGLVAADIAGRLGISERTARYHLDHVKDKLGVCDKKQAIARAMQLGLV